MDFRCCTVKVFAGMNVDLLIGDMPVEGTNPLYVRPSDPGP